MQAYEVLSNENTRQSYLEYLQNPQQSEVYHYYRYYKQAYLPQTNPYIVVFGLALSLSIIQYSARYGMY